MLRIGRFWRRSLLAALTACWMPAAMSAATIIVVRHAERANAMTADAPLSPAGEERARVLAKALGDAGVRRIFVTEVRRVQQTAEPLAARLHLEPVVIPQKNTAELVKQLKALGDDETVLVVGHTTTIPAIVEGLGATVAPVADAEYDRMVFVVTGPGKAHVVTLRYGDMGK